jgi:hypothetical protein
MRKYKSDKKNILALGVLFFMLFFAADAFFVAPVQAAQCGSYAQEDYKYTDLDDLKDTSDRLLCNKGTASGHSESSSEFSWVCSDDDGEVSCKSRKSVVGEEGVCGSADGGTFESLNSSSSSLCDSGSVSGFKASGDGWEWDCAGDDGDDEFCSADKSESADETTEATTTGSESDPNSDQGRGIDLTLDDVVSIIQKVARYFYSIAIVLAVILTIYVGILFFTAGGDETKVIKAKKTLIFLVIGIAIMLIGRGIITFVQNILETGDKESMINFINWLA